MKRGRLLFQAALFDLDGTLLDTIDDLADSMNQVLVSYGLKPYPVHRYFYFVGDGMQTLTHRVLSEQAADLSLLEPCAAAMRQNYSNNWSKKTKPYPGIVEMLRELTRHKVKIAVLSNKPHEFTQIMVRHYFKDFYFEAIEGQKTGVPKKPDPSAAIQIAKSINLMPEAFAYLGDTNTDMKTARSAGMFAVGALWGFRKADELIESGAEQLIDKPTDFVQFF